jgi:hypothetical protein
MLHCGSPSLCVLQRHDGGNAGTSTKLTRINIKQFSLLAAAAVANTFRALKTLE